MLAFRRAFVGAASEGPGSDLRGSESTVHEGCANAVNLGSAREDSPENHCLLCSDSLRLASRTGLRDPVTVAGRAVSDFILKWRSSRL